MSDTTKFGSGPERLMNDGKAIPQLGFGSYKVQEADAQPIIEQAIEVGYRHIDTATIYGNEAAVGRAIAACGVPRDGLFITTKVWPSSMGTDSVRAAFDKSMELLGLDRVDLYLVHWPDPRKDLYLPTWETLIELQATGRITSIGVSNFEPEHIERIVGATGVTPVVNQIELHPFFQQRELQAFDHTHGIVTEAWSPIARGERSDDEVLQSIAHKHEKSTIQVILRWHTQQGRVAIPKTSNRTRMVENLNIFDFELDAADLAAIDGLDAGMRTGPNPMTVEF